MLNIPAKFWTSAVIIAAAFFACFLLRKYAGRIIKGRNITGKKATNANAVITVLKNIIMITAIISVLQIYGIDVSSVAAGLGIVGIVVGFALQDILKDLIMGTSLMWDDFFSIGDTVIYNGKTAQVIDFNIKVTKMRMTEDDSIMTVCNRNISEVQKLSDWTTVAIPFPYEQSAVNARQICGDICVAAENGKFIKKCEFFGTDEFAESSVKYMIKIYCEPQLREYARRELLGYAQDVFAERGISVPYPQLDVHFDRAAVK